MISNDHEFIFPDGDSIELGFQVPPSSSKPSYSDIPSSYFPVTSSDSYVRPRSAPCSFPSATSPLSDPVPEASLYHATPLLSSRIRFIDENHSVCAGQDAKHEQRKHIPRPPNAFMLYRSDFLKKGVIPPEIEKRQQNLSRIAGQCWNMLSESEKAVWHDKAAAIQAAHYAKYPSYKFRPSRKEAGKLSSKEKKESRLADRGKAFIRSLREEYASTAGHSSGPANRSRTCRGRPSNSTYRDSMFAAFHDSHPPSNSSPVSLSSTPSESPTSASSSLSPLSPLSPLSLPNLLPPFTPLTHSYEPDSSPATSHTLIAQRHKADHHLGSATLASPQMGLSDMIRGLEITPAMFSPSPLSYPLFHPVYQDSFGRYLSSLGLGHFPTPQTDSAFQVHIALPESNSCFPLDYYTGGLRLQTTDLHAKHNFSQCDPSDNSWYPWSPNTESSNDGLSST